MSPEVALLEDGRLRLRYQLYELPSAQHKAGLAGLIFLSRNMQARGIGPVIQVSHLDATSTELRFGLDELQATFDELYDGAWQEIFLRSKFSGKEPKRVEEVPVEDNGKTEKRFVYDEFRPKGAYFSYLLEGGEDSSWLKLWQDMLWAVLRAQPKTRGGYKTRANGQPLLLPSKLWKRLIKVVEERTKGRLLVDSVAGSLYIGAQDKNAERVSFQGPVELNLLLYFWHLVTPLFIPRGVDIKNGRLNNQGFLLAIPEVSHLAEFLDDIKRYWQSRRPDKSGYRPTQAMIEVPQEGGLEFLYDLAQLRIANNLALSISAVEWYHQEKRGNNVHMHGHGRLRADRGLLRRYENERNRRANSLFKHLVLNNLLIERPWYEGAARLFASYRAEFFVQALQTPGLGSSFSADTRGRFKTALKDFRAKKEISMSNSEQSSISDALVGQVYDLIGTYVRHRTRERSRMKLEQFSKDENGRIRYPREYREVVEKVAKDAFLAMRGRNGRDFVTYFTGTICSVPQFFGRQDDFIDLSRALITQPDLIKDLSMLALSAHSWMPHAQSATETGD